MPENVIFTKRDEASKYASEVDGQVVGDDNGWRVMAGGYHDGGGITPHKHPHTEAEEKSSMWKEVMDFGKELAKKLKADPEKGRLVTRIMNNTHSTSDSIAASLLALSLSELKKRDSKIAKDKAEKNLAEEMADQEKAGERAREYLEGQNMGGMVDELGYMHGGMPLEKRGPIKYAAGGAVRGKRFVGTF